MSDSHDPRGITFDLPSLTTWEATRREPPGQRGILYDVLQRSSSVIVNTPKSDHPQYLSKERKNEDLDSEVGRFGLFGICYTWFECSGFACRGHTLGAQ